MKQLHLKYYKRELLRKGFSGEWIKGLSKETLIEAYEKERNGFTRVWRNINYNERAYDSLDLLSDAFFVTRKEIELATGIPAGRQIRREKNRALSASDVTVLAQFFCSPIENFIFCKYSIFSLVDIYASFLSSKGRPVEFFSGEENNELQNKNHVLKKIHRQCDVGKTELDKLKNQMHLFDDFRAYRDLNMSPSPELIVLLKTSDLFSESGFFD